MERYTAKKDSKGARGFDAVQNEWMYKSSEFVLENIKPLGFKLNRNQF